MTSANRAAALTHRLLAFARRQPLIPKSVDANQLVVSLEDLLRRTIGETIDLDIVASDDLWSTLCDPNQLESALLNLAINARDAMPDGGKLTISTANARLDGVTADTPALVARRLYLHRCHRHRHRHERGGGGARLRSVLHHQADRAGHRPRAFDDLWICAAVERPCHHRQQARAGHLGQALSAASSWRRRRRACGCRQGGRTCRHRRDRAGGRGRAGGARGHPGDAAASRVTGRSRRSMDRRACESCAATSGSICWSPMSACPA